MDDSNKKTRGKAAPGYCATLLRGLSILTCFTKSSQALGASEIARLTGIPQPTVWRFCQALLMEGYLISDSTGTRFQPGLAVLGLGYSALNRFGIAEHARPYLEALAEKFHAICGISVPERLSMRVIQRYQSPDAVFSFNIRVGWSLSMADTSSGWAYMAGLDGEARERLIAGLKKESAEKWRPAAAPFANALKEFPKLGVMVAADLFDPGVTSVAIPLSGSDGIPRFTLYCAAIRSRLPKKLIRSEVAPEMRRIADALKPIVSSDTFG